MRWIPIIRGGNYGWEFSWVEIFRVGIVLGGSFQDENFPGGSHSGCEFFEWELCGWELSLVAIFFGGSFPGGIIWVAIFRVWIFMLLVETLLALVNENSLVLLSSPHLCRRFLLRRLWFFLKLLLFHRSSCWLAFKNWFILVEDSCGNCHNVYSLYNFWTVQKQPPRGVLREKCSGNM